MGIYDRGYYDGDQWKGGSGNEGGGRVRFGLGTGNFKQTLIAKIILINFIVFGFDVFSPIVEFTAAKKESSAALVTLPTTTPPSATSATQEKNETAKKQEASSSGKGQANKGKSQWINVFFSLKTGLEPVGFSGPAQNPLYSFQFLTYGFTHTSIGDGFGITHIAFNMLALFFFGVVIEEKYGKEEFLKFYLVALLLSGLVWWAIQVYILNKPGRATGASGAVVATVMLFVFNFPKQQILLFGIIPAPAWVMGVLLIGSDLMSTFNTESRIAVSAHLTGAAFATIYFYRRLSLGWLKFNWLTDRLSGKPRLKVHSPEKEEELNSEADRILDKVHREGEESLTRKERKTLQRYSKNVRKTRDD